MKKNSEAPYLARIKHLQKRIAAREIDGCLIENPLDLYSLTGLQLSLGRLFVGTENAELFVDGQTSKWQRKEPPLSATL